MVVGLRFPNGRPAPKIAEEENSPGPVLAPSQNQNMVVKTVLEMLKKQENVTRILVKVCKNVGWYSL